MGSLSLALTREVNLASPSSVPSIEVIIESRRVFQSLIVLGKNVSSCSEDLKSQ